MRSNRPYLLKAFYDWIVDNDCTPYIVVDAHYPEVEVPQDFVTDGQIVLNIAPRAVSSFEMNNNYVQLSTRFSGMPRRTLRKKNLTSSKRDLLNKIDSFSKEMKQLHLVVFSEEFNCSHGIQSHLHQA